MVSTFTTASSPDDEINLRDYWLVLVRRRILILSTIGVITLITIVVVLLLPNVYQGKTTLIPLGQSQGSLQGVLGELGGLLPLGSVGGESPAERIQAILNSRTLLEDVIQRLDLLPRLFPSDWDVQKQQWKAENHPLMHDAVKELGDLVSILAVKETGVISITAEFTDPKLAAAVANQYLHTLQRILNENAFSLAKKNRLFIESQLQKTRQELVVAEEALRDFEQTHNIIALDAQASAAVSAIAALESQIMAKEVQLVVLQRSVTGASREVTLLQEELQGLRTQFARLQHTPQLSRPASTDGTQLMRAFPVFDEAPEIKLQYARLQREALVQNKLFMLLTQQLEQTRIEESRDETAFQVLDEAIPPERKSKPKRILISILGTIVGAFIGVFFAFSQEYLRPVLNTQEQVPRRTGLRLLATIPALPRPRRGQHKALAVDAPLVLHQPFGDPYVESYRFLHTRLKHVDGGNEFRTIVFVSAEPNDFVAVSLVNLGAVAARGGHRTLLIDGNVRDPMLHRLLCCSVAPGLMDILHDPQEWQKGLQHTNIDKLHLLPAGTEHSGTLSLLDTPALDAVIASCKEAYDLILCLAPPVLTSTDAAILSGKVEATCLVLTCGFSRLDAIGEAKTALEAVQANVIGAILTGV